MKRAIYAGIFIFIVFIFCFVSALSIGKTVDGIILFIESGENERAYSLWDEKKEFISLFVKKSDIEEVEKAFLIGEYDLTLYNLKEIKNGILPNFCDFFLIDFYIGKR